MMRAFFGAGKPLFETGRIDVSAGARAALAEHGITVSEIVSRHLGEDGGEPWFQDPRDMAEPETIVSGYRLSAAPLAAIWVTTSADRSVTRVFLQGEA